jgi:hypothetical protein
MPRITVRTGIGGYVRPLGTSVKPWIRFQIEWRIGPMSRAWWRNRDPQELDQRAPRRRGEQGVEL